MALGLLQEWNSYGSKIPAQKEPIYTGVRNLRIVSSWTRTRPLPISSRPSLSCLHTAVSTSPESLNHSLPTEDSLLSKGNMEETYEMNALPCWDHYKSHMDSIKDWCNWTLISRHYSDLQNCLEYHADRFGLGFPNPLAERIFFETHLIHFTNCSLVQPTFSDPPEDVLLAMIIAPICLIPFLVTLVVWRSKDSDAQA
ncbi:receptor activity-modifying protein 2 [Cricetulus griseus]|nr:receptor activity-modifying protein 2 [Cricetulus griseus]